MAYVNKEDFAFLIRHLSVQDRNNMRPHIRDRDWMIWQETEQLFISTRTPWDTDSTGARQSQAITDPSLKPSH